MSAQVLRFPQGDSPDESVEVSHGGGEGGGTDIVVRIKLEMPEMESGPREVEKKGSSVGAFLWGALAGLLWGS